MLTLYYRMTTVGIYYSPYTSNYYFITSAWLIPVVVIGYFVVIVADNLLVWHSNKTISRKTNSNRNHSLMHNFESGERGDVGETQPVMHEEERGDHNV